MDRYFNNGTGVPMSEDDYYEYTAENDLPDEYDFLNVVEQVELTGFEEEDNPVLTKLDEKLKEA